MREHLPLQTRFIYWYYNEFKSTELFDNMRKTVENSPWHREKNVGVHTDMVVAHYLTHSRAFERWDTGVLCGALACAFHDTGKPSSEEQKFSKERGAYKAYPGHELISARLWEDYAVSNWDYLQEEFGMLSIDLYKVGWLIEHHLPWGVKKPYKRESLALTALRSFGNEKVFCEVLFADQVGRLSDNSKEKIDNGIDWINEFEKLTVMMDARSDAEVLNRKIQGKTLYMLISASGSGKSTWIKNRFIDHEVQLAVFSWDDLRLKWYLDKDERKSGDRENYRLAWERQIKDKEFTQKANTEFVNLVKSGVDIAVDNTNTSSKRRRFFVEEAKRHGYFTVAVLFPISLKVLESRQKLRLDKHVPLDAVHRHYFSLQLPQLGEMDEIEIEIQTV